MFYRIGQKRASSKEAFLKREGGNGYREMDRRDRCYGVVARSWALPSKRTAGSPDGVALVAKVGLPPEVAGWIWPSEVAVSGQEVTV